MNVTPTCRASERSTRRSTRLSRGLALVFGALLTAAVPSTAFADIFIDINTTFTPDAFAGTLPVRITETSGADIHGVEFRVTGTGVTVTGHSGGLATTKGWSQSSSGATGIWIGNVNTTTPVGISSEDGVLTVIQTSGFPINGTVCIDSVVVSDPSGNELTADLDRNTAGIQTTSCTVANPNVAPQFSTNPPPAGGVAAVYNFDVSGTVPTTDLRIWLDASREETITVAEGTNDVIEWLDLSGSQNDATQGLTVLSPSHDDANDAIVFDNEWLDIGNLSALFPSAGTVYVVADVDNASRPGTIAHRCGDRLPTAAVTSVLFSSTRRAT